MKTTFILTLAAAAFSSMQAYAVEYVQMKDGDGFAQYCKAYNPENPEDVVLRTNNNFTLIADTSGDDSTCFKGTLEINGAVTLKYNECYTELITPEGVEPYHDTMVPLFGVSRLTFAENASLTIELSDAVLDVLLVDSYLCLGEPDMTMVGILHGKLSEDSKERNITISDSTISRLAERGIQLEAFTGEQDPFEEGKGVYYQLDNILYYYAGKPVPTTPEPATASLSLLALAALASRRRRH